MLTDFQNLPETSKVWIYPSSRKFYDTEIDNLIKKIDSFLSEWNAKKDTLNIAYQFLYQRFIVIAIDDTNDTLANSDIDNLVQFILSLQNDYQVELLDRMNVCFKQGQFVQYKELKDFKQLLKQKAVTGKTIVFDNLIQTKGEFDQFWEVPIEDSWYQRFL